MLRMLLGVSFYNTIDDRMLRSTVDEGSGLGRASKLRLTNMKQKKKEGKMQLWQGRCKCKDTVEITAQ